MRLHRVSVARRRDLELHLGGRVSGRLDADGDVPVAEHGEAIAHVVLAAAERLRVAVALHLRHRAHRGHVVHERDAGAVDRLVLGVPHVDVEDVLARPGRIGIDRDPHHEIAGVEPLRRLGSGASSGDQGKRGDEARPSPAKRHYQHRLTPARARPQGGAPRRRCRGARSSPHRALRSAGPDAQEMREDRKTGRRRGARAAIRGPEQVLAAASRGRLQPAWASAPGLARSARLPRPRGRYADRSTLRRGPGRHPPLLRRTRRSPVRYGGRRASCWSPKGRPGRRAGHTSWQTGAARADDNRPSGEVPIQSRYFPRSGFSLRRTSAGIRARSDQTARASAD